VIALGQFVDLANPQVDMTRWAHIRIFVVIASILIRDSLEQCSWGKESVRRPRTNAHFEALRKRADALEEYANLLESMLEKCWREHGGLNDNGHSYLQFRPQDADAMVLPDDFDVTYDDDMASDSGDDIVQEICLPTQNLVVRTRNPANNGYFRADRR
jgi:hypothetical protein